MRAYPFVRSLARTAGLLVAFATPACDDDAGPVGAVGSGGGELAGTVARQKTGLGVPDVVVVLRKDAAVVATTHTDAQGAFSFKRVVDGEYRVELAGLEGAGIDRRFDALEPEFATASLAGDHVDLVFAVVGLVPPRITGSVECDGLPVPGVTVWVIGGRTNGEFVTNGQGRFAALDLFPGAFAVVVGAAPCSLTPGFTAVDLLPGQVGEASFSG